MLNIDVVDDEDQVGKKTNLGAGFTDDAEEGVTYKSLVGEDKGKK